MPTSKPPAHHTPTRRVLLSSVDPSYRSFIHEGANHFLLLHNQLYTSSGLRTWLHQFAVSTITLQNRVSPTTGVLCACLGV